MNASTSKRENLSKANFNVKVLKEIPVKVDFNETLESVHLSVEKAEKLGFRRLLEEAASLLHPKAVYREAYVTARKNQTVSVNGVEFTSRVLAENLRNVHRVFLYVVTIGEALENAIPNYKSVIKQFYLENVGDLALRHAREYLEKHLVNKYRLGGVAHMSPGQLDWPIEQQRRLFDLIGDAEAKIGVKLTDAFLMVPRKSVSGIMFPTKITFVSCQLCPRKNCPSRQAPYNEELRRKYGLKP